MTKYCAMLDLVFQAWSINSINGYLIPVLLLCKQTSSIIRTILSINCFFIKEYSTLIQRRAFRIIFWSPSQAVLEIWNTIWFTVAGNEIKELSWVARNKRCVLPTSLWMDTILEAKYSPKSFLLSEFHKSEVRKLRGNETSSVICNTRIPDEPHPFLVCVLKLFLK